MAQIGTPEDIYERPDSRFVADFVGSSNVLPPNVLERFGKPAAWGSLRPERIRLLASGDKTAVVKGSSYLGGSIRLQLDFQGTLLNCIQPSNHKIPEQGSTVHIDWDDESLHIMADL